MLAMITRLMTSYFLSVDLLGTTTAYSGRRTAVVSLSLCSRVPFYERATL
ncbi:hypothetical protein AN958_01622 [Leucoagaricus sp. SymC.cos]|nr:hypothetical protein AN958_01622 [Leucoagaricus sp. SymC.cos]